MVILLEVNKHVVGNIENQVMKERTEQYNPEETYLVIFQRKPAIGGYNFLVVFSSEHSRSKWAPCGKTQAVVGVQRNVLRLNLQQFRMKS